MNVSTVYHGSSSADTRRLLKTIEGHGHHGRIAAALFRAQKASARAKAYRGGIDGADGVFRSYKQLGYDNKARALTALCDLLERDACGLAWGWHWDRYAGPTTPEFILYVELPNGQVSFHSFARYAGPDYAGAWDGVRNVSADRIIAFCESVLAGETASQPSLFS